MISGSFKEFSQAKHKLLAQDQKKNNDEKQGLFLKKRTRIKVAIIFKK